MLATAIWPGLVVGYVAALAFSMTITMARRFVFIRLAAWPKHCVTVNPVDGSWPVRRVAE